MREEEEEEEEEGRQEQRVGEEEEVDEGGVRIRRMREAERGWQMRKRNKNIRVGGVGRIRQNLKNHDNKTHPRCSNITHVYVLRDHKLSN